MARCQTCDQENSSQARYCTNCGVPLAGGAYGPAPAQATTATPGSSYAPPPYTYAPANTYPAGVTNAGTAYPAYAYAAAPAIHNTVNVTVTAPAARAATVVAASWSSDPPLLLRALYFLFVGTWLGILWIVLAWLLIASIVGLPLGLMMLNRLPQVMTLKSPRSDLRVSAQHGAVVLRHGPVAQRPFLIRAPYFLLVGWWASLVWLILAYVLILGTAGLGLPLAFWMVNRVPAITTLARS